MCVAWGLHGPVAAHKPSPLRFWRIDSFNCWSAVAGWPEKTGNSPLAQSRRCRLIAVMTAALRLLGPMDRTRLSERCLLTPKPTDLCHSAGPAFLSCVRCRRSSRLCSSPLLHVTNPRGPAALGRPWESPGVMPGGRGRFGRLGGLWTGNSAVAT